MPKNNGSRVVPQNLPHAIAQGSTSSPAPGDDASGLGRLTLPHVLPLIIFPMVGSVLYVVGMPITDVFTFLTGYGCIGAAVTIMATGGRRVLVALAHGILAAMGPK
ncbi:hypothetical protein ACH4FA_36490 [Streptomyces sp. NPDC017966]|uniref:hypothetical protein n=1 Tax=Streptomyces sp. NPDC017966 TaxID=3365023 RepID=UPI00378C5B35